MQYQDLTKDQKVLWRGVCNDEGEDITPDAITAIIANAPKGTVEASPDPWTLTVSTTANNLVFKVNVTEGKNLKVQWGDQVSNDNDVYSICTAPTSAMTHTYTTSGVYKLKLIGDAAGINFNNLPNVIIGTEKIYGFTSLSSLASAFNNAVLMSSVPADLLAGCPNLKDCTAAFRKTGLRAIPASLFTYNTKVSSFNMTFASCVNARQQLNGSLFQYNVSANDFSNCYSGCVGLTGDVQTMVQLTTSVGHIIPQYTSYCFATTPLTFATATTALSTAWFATL